MGAYSTTLPGGIPVDEHSAAELSQRYGFEVPGRVGLSAQEMLEASLRGDLDVLYSSGGNFLDVLPDPALCRKALAQTPLRVHQDIVVTSQMLVAPEDGGEDVLLLPAATRYEQRDGGTETTTERRIAFTHGAGQRRAQPGRGAQGAAARGGAQPGAAGARRCTGGRRAGGGGDPPAVPPLPRPPEPVGGAVPPWPC